MLPSPSGNDCPESFAHLLAVTDASQVGEARRLAARLAGRLGFPETEAGKAALVVTEAANNLLLHGHGGELLFRCLEDGRAGLDVLALDRGPGMADVGRCLQDGYSTGGTAGTGLGGIVRLSAFAEVYSTPGAGTAVLARLWAGPPSAPPGRPPLHVAAVSVPKPGEAVCGDACAVEQLPDRALLLVADGLGHGPLAAAAAREAVRVFRANVRLGPAELLRVVHPALRPTRGAAVAVAEVLPAQGLLHFAGVGNIAGTLLAGAECRSLISHNGTLGAEVHRFQEFVYPYPRGALLVLHSDGLRSRWDLGRYPGLARRDPALVAGVLYRDFKRGRDDVTVLAARAAEDGATP